MDYNKYSLEDMKISYICKNQYQYFLNKKNVVGLALGYKITQGFCTFKKCITVFVKKKLPTYKLFENDLIPNSFNGFMTDIVESGIPRMESLTERIRPSINGYSIGNFLDTSCGTSGCLVKDKYLYILSCNHVIAINNSVPIESAILQPGIDDGGTIKKDVIGHLARYIPIKFIKGSSMPENEVDCALCKVISRSFVSPNIAFVGIPGGTDTAILTENVKKVGRTTELTTGRITNLYGTFTIDCGIRKDALFKNQIVTTRMTDAGDSGSLLLNNNNYCVGLCFGSNNIGTLVNPIDSVLNSLKVTLVTD